MAIGSKVGGVFKTAAGLHAKVNGGWKPAQKGFVKVFDTNTNLSSWKLFWAAEIKDTFGRANTNNTLGTSEGGIDWTILRGAWRIQNNAANTTSAKTEYPLALIDMGTGDFELQANELSPGMGVVVRGFDANNWTAIYPYYNQTSYTYSICVSGRNEGYCISSCSTPAGYNTVCYGTETPASTGTRQVTVPTGCVTTPGTRVCEFAVPRSRTVTTCAPDTVTRTRVCLRNCNSCRESCVSGGQNCIREDGRTRCFARPPVCTTTCSSICCDVDYIYTTVPGACTTSTEYYEECIYYATGPSTTTCSGSTTATETYTIPATCSTGYQQVPYYNCCQSGSRFICEVAGTATAFNQFYYIRVATMLAGVLSYQDIEVTERWNALKVTGLGVTLSINAYKDAGYTQLVKTTSVTNSISATQYGIIGAPSIYEDGRDIGSIQVKAYGQ
jgi:hypothetical protein